MAKKNKSKNKSQGQLVTSLNKLAGALKTPKTTFVSNPRKLVPPGRYLQALRFPFADQSAGVKIPDYDGNPSFTVASKDVIQISTDSAGYAGGVLQFGTPSRVALTSFSNTAGTITLTGGTATAWSDYSGGVLSGSNSIAARVVAGGFRITNLMSLAGSSPAAGRLIIAPVSNLQLFNIASFTESTLRKLPGCMVVPLTALAASCEPVYGITAPLDPSAFCYNSTSRILSGVANDDPQLLSYLYMVVGAPPSPNTALEIEMMCHWEALPQLVNAVLCTVGIESSNSTLEKAFNWVQQHNPITWDVAMLAAEKLAHGYANGHPGRPSLRNG